MGLSRDGRWLYYDSDLSGNSDLYRMALPGGAPERLTTDPADDFFPDAVSRRPGGRLPFLARAARATSG